MLARELRGNLNVKAGQEFADQVTEYRAKYDGLLALLTAGGTEVLRDRTLEVDPDIRPNNFVRHAVHDFVFPPQPDASTVQKSKVIPNTPPYTLTHEDRSVEYDESKVEGYLTVRYDDAGTTPTLRVIDGWQVPSSLPPEVSSALDELLADASTIEI